MDNKVNYTLIGIVVIFSISLMVGFSYWLIKPSDEKEMKIYNIRFDESVLGLNIDAPVKYRGISVGKVIKLGINPKNSEQVEVYVSILKSAPIKANTAAKLTSQGITGLSYINLSVGYNDDKPILHEEGEKYPVIKTIPSLFDKLESSFGSMSENLTSTLIMTQDLLDDENQRNFSSLLDNSSESMARVKDILNEKNQKDISVILQKTASVLTKMDKLLDEHTIKNMQGTMANLNRASARLDVIMPKVDQFLRSSIAWEDKISASFISITSSYNNISSSMLEFQKAVASGQFNLKDISSDLIPTMNNTFLEVQQLMIKLEDMINQYERSPGDILFKQEKIKKGPGEG